MRHQTHHPGVLEFNSDPEKHAASHRNQHFRLRIPFLFSVPHFQCVWAAKGHQGTNLIDPLCCSTPPVAPGDPWGPTRWPWSELRKFSGKSYSGRYPTSGSRSLVAKYFLVGVRIRNEYPHVAALRLLLLRVLKTRPGVGIAFRDTPATPSTPPDPAHNRQSALRIGSHTPPQAPSTTPPSHGAVALGP